VDREVFGLKVVPFSLPDGCLGADYPEMNPLIPLSHHDDPSKTPAARSVPVRIMATGGADRSPSGWSRQGTRRSLFRLRLVSSCRPQTEGWVA